MPYSKIKSENYSGFGGINTKVSPYNTGAHEFLDLVNYNFKTPGSLTQRNGSTQYIGATVTGRITGIYEFERLSGFSQLIVTANTNAYYVNGSNLTAFKTGLLNGAIFDFVTFVDRLFYCNGDSFQKWDGTNNYNFSLPDVQSTFTITAGSSGVASGMTGVYQYSYGYLNERGYLGPASVFGVSNSISFFAIGATQIFVSGLTAPSGYGITAIAIYRSAPNSLDLFRIGYASPTSATFVDTNFPLTTDPANYNLWFTLMPRYMELYNNQLFLAGFSSLLSTMYWSDIGEPESVDPTYFAELRSNDGDRITALKFYNSTLLAFKQKSFAQIIGDTPTNLLVKEISDQYGCLSNRAVVTFNDTCYFLDRKGVVEYNGANVKIISARVEPIFKTMNVDAAIDNAVAVHNKEDNELWFGIPTNGSTLINTTVVYDYVVDAWTKYEGFNPSSLAIARNRLSSPSPIYGDYSGSIYNFGASLPADNLNGLTTIVKTYFLHDLGQSTEKQWRRLYLNVDPIVGLTASININLCANYGASINASRTMYLNPFQSRIDFGIPAKSLQVQFTSYSSTLFIKIYGYTIESRFQRNT